MNRIVLIGNGFDLAHDLPTGYKDFISWYCTNRNRQIKSSMKCKEEDGLCVFSSEDRFHNLSSVTYRCPIFSDWRALRKWLWEHTSCRIEFYPLLEAVIDSIQNKNWVDIEREYYNLLKKSRGRTDDSAPKEINKEMGVLQKYLTEYLSSLPFDSIPPDNRIKELIYEPVSKNDIAISGMTEYKPGLPDHILMLNFNYTPLSELYLNPEFADSIHIHGSLEDADRMIFGYGDELDDEYKEIEKEEDNELLCNIKSVRYLESDNYRNALAFIESAPFQVYIMGHSCGNSDRTLLNTIFEHKNCISIKPFYHKCDDGTDNYREIVQSLSRNFRNKQLMRDRVVNKTFCEPLPQTSNAV